MSSKSIQYTVLARRFRPQNFSEVVGQGMVAQALQNAIRGDRVAHAYLFTGARGVGKTSMARILAKALNCPHTQDGIPCGTCEVCQNISVGSDVDVLEIDGASNRGIDDIRSLRANVNVRSMRSKYKIYIIDEVHMLTKEAFNALLKTLEEPPPNVKFIFCTTEPNKLPDTILSRCQRFDFGYIEENSICDRLKQIAEAEQVSVSDEAIQLVARRAGGSMRDSQSIFDQLLSFGESHLTAESVHRILGTASDERLIQLIDALIEQQRDVALTHFDAALNAGVQLNELVDQLLNYLRDLSVVATGASQVTLLSISEGNRASLQRQSEAWGIQTCLAAFQILNEARNRMFRASHGRALVELALIRMSLLEDLDLLSQFLSSGGQLPAAPTAVRQASPRLSASEVSQPVSEAPATPVERPEQPTDQKKIEKKNEIQSPVASEPVENSAPAAETVPFRAGMESLLLSQLIENTKDLLKDSVKGVTSIAISGPKQLDLQFSKSYNFSKQYCERPEMLARLENSLEKVTGERIKIRLIVQEAPTEPEDAADKQNRPSVAQQRAEQRELAPAADEFLQEALSVFNAQSVRVDVLKVQAEEKKEDS
ncbi:DNA polymerase III subunit gamma/tau [Gimesia sp.]|uniref:DNA polymerase III subunit gamma/tau n=1 Tax=Gimesia sp. TaxID=2024833 RepID=UPI0025BC9FF5|nr:DNA polymerase III subunit gamma/tau [Gimesia sp.]|tara:strand:+ start:933 stop:2726 length:1794 start_codon:yes stop_codon:yes gene_type:complete